MITSTSSPKSLSARSQFAQNNGDIMNPGTAGTTYVYYKQIMALSMKGYRVISVDIPRVWNNQEWVQAFEKFLDVIDVHHIRLSDSIFDESQMVHMNHLLLILWTLLLHRLRPWGDLASRLTLISDVASVGPLLLSDSLITIMDGMDLAMLAKGELKEGVLIQISWDIYVF
ncbi:unnamed protein product [Lactuca saligna]|uniref:Uncharacterized protein n=1 Tax=Lactuca saligna TaxID=75948 RepID=A0AA35Z5B3_LACSI|nr:unnamed protein product [Lactuca saligna]